jgi:hypothetical protein
MRPYHAWSRGLEEWCFQSESELRKPPIPNSYWVNDHLLAGEYPGGSDDQTSRDRLVRLLEAGIRVFIDLTEAYELPPYDAILQEEAAARGLSVQHVRMSIRDARVTSVRHMEEILGNIDRHARASRPTYVHCWGGIGRTGTVIGCHLVEQGHTGDEALAEVARLFATMSKEKLRNHPSGSPETEAQRAMVREWNNE